MSNIAIEQPAGTYHILVHDTTYAIRYLSIIRYYAVVITNLTIRPRMGDLIYVFSLGFHLYTSKFEFIYTTYV